MTELTLSRREAVGAIGVGGVATLAGCSLGGGSGGGGGPYTAWLATPNELPNHEHYQFAEYDVGAISQHGSDWSEGLPVNSDSLVGVETDEMNRVVQTVPTIFVVDGSYDTGTVESRLSEAGYERVDEYEGYAFFQTGRSDPTVAVGDVVLASQSPTYEPITRMKTAIDARAGEVDRYAATNDNCSLIVDRLGSGAVRIGMTRPSGQPATGGMRNVTGFGATWTIDGDTSTVRYDYLFERTDDVPDRGRERIARRRAFNSRDQQVSVSGRFLRIQATYRTEDVAGLAFV